MLLPFLFNLYSLFHFYSLVFFFFCIVIIPVSFSAYAVVQSPIHLSFHHIAPQERYLFTLWPGWYAEILISSPCNCWEPRAISILPSFSPHPWGHPQKMLKIMCGINMEGTQRSDCLHVSNNCTGFKSLATKAASSSHATCLSVWNLKDEFSPKRWALKTNIKLGFGKESVFLHRKVLLTFNYEAASQRSFVLVAIRNWVILARALVKLQVPPPPLPTSSSNWLTLLRLTGLNFEVVLGVQWLGCTSECTHGKDIAYEGRRPCWSEFPRKSLSCRR